MVKDDINGTIKISMRESGIKEESMDMEFGKESKQENNI